MEQRQDRAPSNLRVQQGVTIWLSHAVQGAIVRLAQAYFPLEVGGLLLGWRDDRERIVTGLVGPGPGALHGRNAFVPDHAWQVAQLHQAFSASGGDLDYLGDWHSHPAGAAQLSPVDRTTLARIARRVPDPIMVIAAGAGHGWTLGSWSGKRAMLWRPAVIEERSLRPFTAPSEWSSFGLDQD